MIYKPKHKTSESIGNIIEINNLKKSFGENQVIRGFNLTVKERENVAVLGQSGSGKSVLIKCVIGLVEADSGSIRVLGKDITKLNRASLDQLRTNIGFLFQSNALYDSMTVRENLAFPLRRLKRNISKAETDAAINEALEDVGLVHTLHLMPSELSGGMRKRISIARTLIVRPKIILYDEPTTGLDPITSKEIILLMNRVHEKYQTSSIIISHDLNCIKLTAHRIIILKDGINYQEGSFEELKNSEDKWIKRFFNA
jgi:phospholipid/cholesterol/gamma-HCH transport system ATP-binding protein